MELSSIEYICSKASFDHANEKQTVAREMNKAWLYTDWLSADNSANSDKQSSSVISKNNKGKQGEVGVCFRLMVHRHSGVSFRGA